MADWSQERGPFCGFRCYADWQRVHSTGPANPNYREHSTARQSSEWERNRLAALDRDGHQCQMCGSTVMLHVHHRKHWNPEDPQTHAVGNLVTLCAACHKQVHPGHGGQGQDGKFVSAH
jgi:5-methylcytosine-specific restriction endonuclease McrA